MDASSQFGPGCGSKDLNPASYCSTTLDKDYGTNMKHWIENSLQQLKNQVECCNNLSVLSSVKSHLSAAMAVMDARSTWNKYSMKILKKCIALHLMHVIKSNFNFFST